MTSTYDIATMDELLTRDWFIEDEDIEYVLDSATAEAWEWVYTNRAKYSTRIRLQIEPDDYRVPLEKLTLRVVDLSDKRFETIKSDRKKALDGMFEKDWVKYSDSLPDRPYNSVDTNLDNAWNKFSHAKSELTKYIDTPTKKYGMPSRVSFKQTDLEEKVRVAENEYLATQKLVDSEDEVYWNKQRDEYLKIWVPTL
jgi:hypothetical protein